MAEPNGLNTQLPNPCTILFHFFVSNPLKPRNKTTLLKVTYNVDIYRSTALPTEGGLRQ